MEPPAPFGPGATRKPANTVRVGVGVLVRRGHQVYAGIRSNSHGHSKLALPGGHLEWNETWIECAVREVQEEMGVELQSAQFFHATNDIMRDDHKHYVTIFMTGSLADDAVPENKEPEKCEGWNLFSLQQLLERQDALFIPLRNLLQDKQSELEILLSSE